MAKKRKLWDYNNMLKAIEAVKNGLMGTRKASTMFNVPRSTLQDRLHNRQNMNAKMGRKPILCQDDEMQLTDYACNRADLGIGFGKRQFLRYAAQLAQKRRTPFKNIQPSEKWWRAFKRRNPHLVHRRPEATSSIRHKQMNKANVQSYFQAVRNIVEKYDLKSSPAKIWNMDETGIQLDYSCKKILAKKGARTVQIRNSGKREMVTVIAAVNAEGIALPPHFIMKGKTERCLRSYDVLSAPVGSFFSTSDSGWTKNGLALLWFKNVFLKHIGPERPQLLIFDGHDSHTFMELIDIASAENIHFVEIPAHTSHWLQPLDRSVFFSLKTAYNKVCAEVMTNPTGHLTEINHSNFCGLFKKAWHEAMTKENIRSGFQACGLYPLNEDAIPNEAYIPGSMYIEQVTKYPDVILDNMSNRVTKNSSIEENSVNTQLNPSSYNLCDKNDICDLSKEVFKPHNITGNVQHNKSSDLSYLSSLYAEEVIDDPDDFNENIALNVNKLHPTCIQNDIDKENFSPTIDNSFCENPIDNFTKKSFEFSSKDISGQLSHNSFNCSQKVIETIPSTSSQQENHCSPALALHALNLALGYDKIEQFKNILKNEQVCEDKMFLTWKKSYLELKASNKPGGSISFSTNPLLNKSIIASPEPLLKKSSVLIPQNKSSPSSPDNDILPYPICLKDKGTPKRKVDRKQKFFILTSEEAIESKRKAIAYKNEKEKKKELRIKARLVKKSIAAEKKALKRKKLFF